MRAMRSMFGLVARVPHCSVPPEPCAAALRTLPPLQCLLEPLALPLRLPAVLARRSLYRWYTMMPAKAVTVVAKAIACASSFSILPCPCLSLPCAAYNLQTPCHLLGHGSVASAKSCSWLARSLNVFLYRTTKRVHAARRARGCLMQTLQLRYNESS